MYVLKYKINYSQKYFFSIIFFLAVIFCSISNGFAKEICITNFGKDPIAMVVGTSMHWLDARRGRCVQTNETEALIQNADVKDVCSFDEKTTTVDLIIYACFRVKGEAGKCVPEIESWEFAEDCEKRVKRSNKN
ncbi:MAG TPA: hypothetical protein EYQ51_06430 [Alphaproteobacteria bacterium]|jgi:hypothetical protein|nr:hypothetical protein [Alphaproteobacteria bacterium]HIK87059.1 hypothetical protein [Alphaproteobacteria bacterium]